MSTDNDDNKYVTFNNSTYQIEAYLANANDKGSAFPIRKANINYLEVEDSLAFPGLRGSINISNFYGIIQKYDLFDIVNDINLLIIDITNKDASGIAGGLPIKLAFESIVCEALETSKNIVDKQIILSFEEFNAGYLRYRYISSSDLKESTGSCSSYIKQVILKGLNKTEVKDVFKVEDSGDIADTGVPAPIGSIITQTESCYDVLRFLMRNCYFDSGVPSLLRLQNFYEDKKLVRKYKLTNLGTFMSNFFTEIDKGDDADVSKYLLETFISGDSSSTSTFGSNFIDKYDLLRPNFKDTLSKKWVSHGIASQSGTLDGGSEYGFFTFEEAKEFFEEKVLGGKYAANLPGRSISSNVNSGGTKTITELTTTAASPNALVTVTPDIYEWQESILATMLKSFIYDNTAITFTVPGGLHREAGYFIKIKVEKNAEERSKTQDISGYYFIISVTHIFSGENYQNRIVAVKVNKNEKPVKSSNNSLLSKLLTPKSSTTSTTSESITTESTNTESSGTATTIGTGETKAGDVIPELPTLNNNTRYDGSEDNVFQ